MLKCLQRREIRGLCSACNSTLDLELGILRSSFLKLARLVYFFYMSTFDSSGYIAVQTVDISFVTFYFEAGNGGFRSAIPAILMQKSF